MREKPNSPFYPDKPLPSDKFFGRDDLVRDIWVKDIQPILNHCRTQTVWLSGERGIGKSSLANYLLDLSEREGLLPLKINLSRVHTVNDLIESIIYKILEYKDRSKDPVNSFIKNNFSKYFEEVELQVPILGGLKAKIKKEEVQKDIPEYKRNFEEFLKSFVEGVKQQNYIGVFLLLDEINGLASDPEFANFLKGLSDNLDAHLSLMFMICGTEEKRQAIIKNHESVNRVFRSLYNLKPISKEDFAKYFIKEFASCEIDIKDREAELMASFAYGQPRFAQIIGDTVFYSDEDSIIDTKDVHKGIFKAFDEIGEKFIKPLYDELKSNNYKELIKKIVGIMHDEKKETFERATICKNLSKAEQKLFDNFIKRMKELGFIQTNKKGEYRFKDFFTQAYLGLLCDKEQKEK